MPTVLFADDPELEKGKLFVIEALRGGAWLHPQHNMFLSAAHTDADIDRALQATDARAGRRAQELRARLRGAMTLAADKEKGGPGSAGTRPILYAGSVRWLP